MSSYLKKRRLHPSILELLFSLPKTIWFNFKVLPFKSAMKLPFFISCHTKVKGVNRKNFVCTLENPKFGMCRIGISGSETGLLIKKTSLLYIHNGGSIYVKGPISISRGIYIEANKGKIIFGKDIKMNTGCYIEAETSNIEIGNDCSFGWNCVVKNCDGHVIISDGEENPNNGNIVIGNHCWICSESSILKNSFLPDNSILAYKSLLIKKITEKPGCLFAGTPAKVVKENINWRV